MENACSFNEIFLHVPHQDGVFVNLTMHADGTYELGGVEGKFLGMLLDFMDVIVRIYTNMNDLKKDGAQESQISMFGRFGLKSSFLESKYTHGPTYEMNSLTFALKKTVPLSTRFSFLYPYTFNSWIGFLTTWIVLSVFGFFLIKKKISYLDLSLQMLGCFFNQSIQVSSYSLKMRILIFVWLFFTMVISYSYSAIFFSFMVNPLKLPPVRNFKELSAAVTEGTHKCYVCKTQYILRNLQMSNQSYIKQLAEIAEDNDFYFYKYDLQKHEEYIIQGNAILRDRSFLNLMFGMNSEIFISTDAIVNELGISLIFYPGFCWAEKIKTLILRAWSAGLYQKIHRDEQMKRNNLKGSRSTSSVRPLSLNDVSGVFIILLFGLLVSFVVFLMKIAVYNFKRMHCTCRRWAEFLIIKYYLITKNNIKMNN